MMTIRFTIKPCSHVWLLRHLRTHLLLCLLLGSTLHLSAQADMQVADFHLDEADTTAIAKKTAVLDSNNGKTCALIKVETTESGFSFDVGMLGIEKVETKSEIHPTEIWVYVPEGVKRISMSHPQLEPLQDYDLQQTLVSGKTYRLQLKTKELSKAYGVLSVTTSPPDATVCIDGKEVGKTPLLLKDVLVGTREVQVSLDVYTSYHSILISQEQPASLQLDIDLKVYDTVTENARFPGGDDALYRWIAENLEYPEIANINGIQGRVFVRFVVNIDGSITDVKVMRSPDPSLTQEAIRLVKSMPKWRPARYDNKPVRSKIMLPLMFRLFEDN